MPKLNPFLRVIHIACIAALIGMLLIIGGNASSLASVASVYLNPTAQPRVVEPLAEPQAGSVQYLPFLVNTYPWPSPFGIESNSSLTSPTLLNYTKDLNVKWVRLNERVSWKRLQPQENGPIQWSLLQEFEQELRALQQAGVTPIVIVDDSPLWATRLPTSCSAIRPEKFGKFAAFMRALVQRYSTSEFNVHHWELGNEPDVDPGLVGPDSVYGCWGDINDPFYGGRTYGEMLKVVTPAIRGADPAAQVWIGGLLLDRPLTTAPGRGRPELFLKGILEAGAAPYFDIVPYHWYSLYGQMRIDYDRVGGGQWNDRGGGVVGKAHFLREIMQQYGVNKPVFLNETSFACLNTSCNPPDEMFYKLQSSMLVRKFVRGLSANIMGFIWYTLEGPGWRHGGLLTEASTPKSVYTAYQVLNSRMYAMTYAGTADYGAGIEAYAFRSGPVHMHVLWAKEDQSIPIRIPGAQYSEAVDIYGNTLTPTSVGGDMQLTVTFDPIYVIRTQ